MLLLFLEVNSGQEVDVYKRQAYACMILQPYVSMDGLGMALMSQDERYALTGIASDTSGALLQMSPESIHPVPVTRFIIEWPPVILPTL